ncbi:MAG: hypothetical protein PHD70_10325 [Anaerostipes sp.]|nr:hypothetical protein [Anaerostipes sp.]
MKKKYILGLILAIFLIFILLVPQSKYAKIGNQIRLLFVYQNQDTNSSEDIYAKGKKIVITKKEMQTQIKIGELLGQKDAEKKAYNSLKQEKTLYENAKENGYSTSNKEVEEYTNTVKKTLENTPDSDKGKKIVLEMIKGFGGEENYWKMSKKRYNRSLTIKKYLDQIESTYFKKNKLEQGSVDGDKAWYKYREKFIAKLIEEQHIKKTNVSCAKTAKKNTYQIFQKDYQNIAENYKMKGFSKTGDGELQHSCVIFPENKYFKEKKDMVDDDFNQPVKKNLYYLNKDKSILIYITQMYSKKEVGKQLITSDIPMDEYKFSNGTTFFEEYYMSYHHTIVSFKVMNLGKNTKKQISRTKSLTIDAIQAYTKILN